MRRIALTISVVALGVLGLTPSVAFGAALGGDSAAAQDDTTEDDDADGQPNCPDPQGDEDNQHPSGRDKHCEPGASGDQGNARSDPDDDGRGPDRSNGGADQPGGEGGEDELDQDANNGCGNDDDFEDDNEGWCGKPDREGGEQAQRPEQPERPDQPERAGEAEQPGQPEQPEQPERSEVGGETSGDVVESVDAVQTVDSDDAVGTDAGTSDSVETAVLGIQFERAPSDQPAPDGEVDAAGSQVGAAPSGLARTGIPAGLLGLAGLGLVTAGLGLRRRA